jgi:hypothetical protein
MNTIAFYKLITLATGLTLLAASDGSGDPQANAALGSSHFAPSADQPVGWRGDGTGRYPGATPPLHWSRRAKGITSDLKHQARKPTGEPAQEAIPVEYFTLKNWLVAGPFQAGDPGRE